MLAEALDNVMSVQLRERFGFEAGLVSAGMLASIVGALMLAACMAAVQILTAARLPTMKLEATEATPELSLDEGVIWHLFLCAAASILRAAPACLLRPAGCAQISYLALTCWRCAGRIFGAVVKINVPPSSGSSPCSWWA